MNKTALHTLVQMIIIGILMLICADGNAAVRHELISEHYGDRDLLIYVPRQLPHEGERSLVIVLHGGMGNASRIASMRSEMGLNMNSTAERYGFIVAYLNGTPVTRIFGHDKLGWNAGGGCCGQSAERNVDDVGYITETVRYLISKYGIDHNHIYGIGHSNGAMMSQRLICETDLYNSIVAISGPLNLKISICPKAQGKHVLAIHGENDKNVPIQGGKGSQGFSHASYNSEEQARQTFVNSGASYELQVVKGADHNLDHLENVIKQTEGITISEKAARYFGLVQSNPQ